MPQPLSTWFIQSLLLHSNYINPKPSCDLALSKAAVLISEGISYRNAWQYHSIVRALLFLFNNRSLHADIPRVAGKSSCWQSSLCLGTVLTFQQKKDHYVCRNWVFPVKGGCESSKYIFATEHKSKSAAALKCLFWDKWVQSSSF